MKMIPFLLEFLGDDLMTTDYNYLTLPSLHLHLHVLLLLLLLALAVMIAWNLASSASPSSFGCDDSLEFCFLCFCFFLWL
jgi:hypothetical protein